MLIWGQLITLKGMKVAKKPGQLKGGIIGSLKPLEENIKEANGSIGLPVLLTQNQLLKVPVKNTQSTIAKAASPSTHSSCLTALIGLLLKIVATTLYLMFKTY